MPQDPDIYSKMDSLMLSMVMFIFLFCLGLHFATAEPQTPTSIPIPSVSHIPVRNPPPMVFLHPAVLRQNVAVARLMRLEALS